MVRCRGLGHHLACLEGEFAMSGVRVDQLLASATIVLLVLAAGELTGSMSVGRGGARFPERIGATRK
jgi:hypothetical protein